LFTKLSIEFAGTVFAVALKILDSETNKKSRSVLVASYPGRLIPAFFTCSTNVGEGLVKLSHMQ